MKNCDKRFYQFSFASKATDVSSQQTECLSETFAVEKNYFSGKDKIYEHIIELSVLHGALFIVCTDRNSELVPDLAIFIIKKWFHKKFSKRFIQDIPFPDFKLLSEIKGNDGTVFADTRCEEQTESILRLSVTFQWSAQYTTIVTVSMMKIITPWLTWYVKM